MVLAPRWRRVRDRHVQLGLVRRVDRRPAPPQGPQRPGGAFPSDDAQVVLPGPQGARAAGAGREHVRDGARAHRAGGGLGG